MLQKTKLPASLPADSSEFAFYFQLFILNTVFIPRFILSHKNRNVNPVWWNCASFVCFPKRCMYPLFKAQKESALHVAGRFWGSTSKINRSHGLGHRNRHPHRPGRPDCHHRCRRNPCRRNGSSRRFVHGRPPKPFRLLHPPQTHIPHRRR